MQNHNKQKRMFQQKNLKNLPTALKRGVRPCNFKFILGSAVFVVGFFNTLKYAEPREKNITY